jgi:YidC/Oxa1 family membrane protein insertase
MDRKNTAIAIGIALAFMAGWYFLISYVNRTYPPDKIASNPPAVQQAAAVPGTQPAATTTAAGASATTSPAQMTAASTTGWQVVSPLGSANATPLGSAARKDPQYALQLHTSAAGAAVDLVVLNDFLKEVEGKDPYTYQQVHPLVEERYGKSLATRTIMVDGQAIDVSKVGWTLENQDGRSATYSLWLGTGGRRELKVLKTYRVFERGNTEHPGAGFEVRLDYDFENHAGRPLQVSLGYNGPAMPPRELDNGPDQRVMAGYHSPKALNISVENHYVESFRKDDQTRELAQSSKQYPAWWIGTSSIYFSGILIPPVLEGSRAPSIQSFKGIGLDPAAEHQPVALIADTVAMTVNAGQKLNYPMYVFFGPKWREVLNKPLYEQLPRDFDQTLVVRAGPCSVCTFDWLIGILVAMLGAFHTITRDWGLAIISLVILVRMLLHPITKRSQVSMMKMGKMGPELERLKKKYADNKEELQKAMWEFQKQQGITPILGCLPMFLQMPIWIALWSALNTTFELRHSSFLWGWTWIKDLAKPDRLILLPAAAHFRIPLIGVHVDAINLLPMLLAVVFYFQQKLQPKPPTMTPEQAQQQKIMQTMMVFLFPLFLYSQPSGLNLYILASTGIGIWESRRIRAHIKQKEEAEKAGVVLVDAEPPVKAGGKGKGDKGKGGKGRGTGAPATAAQPSPGGWLARKIADFQKKAEEMQRDAERRRGRDRA